MKIAIIGGGASGLWAANQIKRKLKDVQVTIYEKTDKCGRKILSSGNGRGNLSNVNVGPDYYNHPDLVAPIIQKFSYTDFADACLDLGVLLSLDEQGRAYPFGDSSLIFLEALRLSNIDLGVIEKVLTPVYQIDSVVDKFLINGQDEVDMVIFATGSQAGVPIKYQGKESQNILQSLGHSLVASIPTLSSIGVNETLKMVNGQRADVTATLIIDDKVILQRQGEVLFREKALSGIVIFELSSHLAWYGRTHKMNQAIIRIDLLPHTSLAAVIDMLNHRPSHLTQGGFERLLTGVFHPSINAYLAYRVNDVQSLAQKMKCLDFHVDFGYSPDNHQVMNGGVDLLNIDSKTLESKIHANLYIVGEALDIDGECGGFNLHFAWASATYAVQAIIEKQRR